MCALQVKVGQLFASLARGAPLEHVRVELGQHELTVSRHDIVYEDILATKVEREIFARFCEVD